MRPSWYKGQVVRPIRELASQSSRIGLRGAVETRANRNDFDCPSAMEDARADALRRSDRAPVPLSKAFDRHRLGTTVRGTFPIRQLRRHRAGGISRPTSAADCRLIVAYVLLEKRSVIPANAAIPNARCNAKGRSPRRRPELLLCENHKISCRRQTDPTTPRSNHRRAAKPARASYGRSWRLR
jgi:hypothetical protein